jgi:hypothetical protein
MPVVQFARQRRIVFGTFAFRADPNSPTPFARSDAGLITRSLCKHRRRRRVDQAGIGTFEKRSPGPQRCPPSDFRPDSRVTVPGNNFVTSRAAKSVAPIPRVCAARQRGFREAGPTPAGDLTPFDRF